MDRTAAQDAGRRLRLNREVRRAVGASGDRRGASVGASLELHDYRRYVPGDDLRYVDWAAYGRTREVMVRLFREEVSPDVDVLVDVSRSMGLDDGRKADLTRELALFALASAQCGGARTRLGAVGEDLLWIDDAATLDFAAARCALFEHPKRCATQLRRRGLCVVLSDFLSPRSPGKVLRTIAAQVGQLIVLMVLGPWEANPAAAGAHTLVDAETGRELPLHIVERRRATYLRRLDGIRAELRDSCARGGAGFAEVRADCDVAAALRRDLLPPGIVVPR